METQSLHHDSRKNTKVMVGFYIWICLMICDFYDGWKKSKVLAQNDDWVVINIVENMQITCNSQQTKSKEKGKSSLNTFLFGDPFSPWHFSGGVFFAQAPWKSSYQKNRKISKVLFAPILLELIGQL